MKKKLIGIALSAVGLALIGIMMVSHILFARGFSDRRMMEGYGGKMHGMMESYGYGGMMGGRGIGGGAHGFNGCAGGIGMFHALFLVIGLAVLGYYLFRRHQGKSICCRPTENVQADTLEILKLRYAKGEISQEEFQRTKNDLLS